MAASSCPSSSRRASRGGRGRRWRRARTPAAATGPLRHRQQHNLLFNLMLGKCSKNTLLTILLKLRQYSGPGIY